MLEEKLSKLGYLMGITFLLCVIAFMGYRLGTTEGARETASTLKNYAEGENKDLKKALDQYGRALSYYQNLFYSGFLVQEDGMVFVKKDTLIIPPQEAKTETKQAT